MNPNEADLIVSEMKDNYELENRYEATKVSIVDGKLRIFTDNGEISERIDRETNVVVV